MQNRPRPHTFREPRRICPCIATPLPASYVLHRKLLKFLVHYVAFLEKLKRSSTSFIISINIIMLENKDYPHWGVSCHEARRPAVATQSTLIASNGDASAVMDSCNVELCRAYLFELVHVLDSCR